MFTTGRKRSDQMQCELFEFNASSLKMARSRAWRPARRKCRSKRSPSPLPSDNPRCRVRWRHHTKTRTLDRPIPPRSADTIHGPLSTSADGLPVNTWTCVTPDVETAGLRGYDCFVYATAASPRFQTPVWQDTHGDCLVRGQHNTARPPNGDQSRPRPSSVSFQRSSRPS